MGSFDLLTLFMALSVVVITMDGSFHPPSTVLSIRAFTTSQSCTKDASIISGYIHVDFLIAKDVFQDSRCFVDLVVVRHRHFFAFPEDLTR